MRQSRDVVVVGGGIGGAALATRLARHGVAVTVLERQHRYRDRVRGEFLAVWGVAEAQRLGVVDLLLNAGGSLVTRRVPYDEAWSTAVAEASVRDNAAILPGVPGTICASHPAVCAALSRAAEAAGAVVVRGVSDVRLTFGPTPEVRYRAAGAAQRLGCRLVVGADGRASGVRAQAGIALHGVAPTHLISGLLVDAVPDWPQDTSSTGTQGDVMFLGFPQGGARLRLYLCTALDQRDRYAGPDGTRRFLDEFRRLSCLPWAAAVAAARPIGPCATFPGDDSWTDAPVAPGVALIGDAAGYNDPIMGQGLAIALRDARVLGDLLLAEAAWSPARLRPYADERGERMRRLRFTAALQAALQSEFGPAARERRARFNARVRAGDDPRLRLALAAANSGPELVPAWAFTPEMRANVLG